MKKQELIAPAGDMEKLKYALTYGADAVYIGGKSFSLRVRAKNFTDIEMEKGVNFAHSLGKKVYVTLNAYLRNEEFQEIEKYLEFLYDINIDGVIVSDPGVLYLIKKKFPDLHIHLSTQTNITNYMAAKFYKEMFGIQRIVLARELTIGEIKTLKEAIPDLAIEVFIHGAMCISYSGRCLLSEYFLRRNANRGDCAQSCRWTYYLMEKKRPGEYYPVFEDDRGTYILSSKDLMTLPVLKELVDIGIDAFKIEGRVKTLHYVATVVYAYRTALNAILSGGDTGQEPYNELEKISHREYWSGFFQKGAIHTTTHKNMLKSYAEFSGKIEHVEENYTLIRVKNRMKIGEVLEFLTPSGILPFKPLYFEKYKEEEWLKVDTVHPNDLIRIEKILDPYALLRRIK